jgi:tetratricopeptide (TPR) repeat protein
MNQKKMTIGDEYWQLGQKAEAKGQTKEAKEYFQKASIEYNKEKSPRNEAYALGKYAALSMLMGNTQEAKASFLKSLEILEPLSNQDDLKTPILYGLSGLLYNNGNYEESLNYFPRALENLKKINKENIDPENFAAFLEMYRDSLEKSVTLKKLKI